MLVMRGKIPILIRSLVILSSQRPIIRIEGSVVNRDVDTARMDLRLPLVAAYSVVKIEVNNHLILPSAVIEYPS
jgi:hypothetical protein